MKIQFMAITASFLTGSMVYAAGFTGVVQCAEKGNLKDVASIRMKNGEIIPWNAKGMVKAKGEDSLFFLLTLNEDGGLEYSKTARAKNGFALVTVGTTADEVTLGISPDLSQGFFKYRDTGSGNGDQNLELVCSAKKQ